jgi:hypothetical protein
MKLGVQGRFIMNVPNGLIAVASIAILGLSSTTFGQQPSAGAAADAKAMLSKAVAAVKQDKAKALDMFNKGEGGFRAGDLYVICLSIPDNKFVATGNPNGKYLLGGAPETFKDIDGSPMGITAAIAKPEGEITVTDYEFPKPGADKTPVPKQTYITKVDDLVCGAGYYYFNNE